MGHDEPIVVDADNGSLSGCGCRPGAAAASDDAPQRPERRAWLTGVLASGVALSLPPAASAADPRVVRPQPGDVFVFAIGQKARTLISDADLPSGGPPVLAWPMDPANNTIRDGSRLNQVLILRLDESGFDETTRARAADGGLVAYSASCTHALCPVTGWRTDRRIVHCPCHNSEFDPSRGAKVVFGPAPRPLPALPLKAVDGAPVAAGIFTGRVGASPT